MEAGILRQRLLYELRESWHQLIHWQLPSVTDLQINQATTTTTTLDLTALSAAAATSSGASGGSRGERWVPAHRRSASGASRGERWDPVHGGRSAVVAASARLGSLSSDVERLCRRLMSRFVTRITRDPSTQLHITDTPHCAPRELDPTFHLY